MIELVFAVGAWIFVGLCLERRRKRPVETSAVVSDEDLN